MTRVANHAPAVGALPKVGDKLPPRVFPGFEAADLLRYAKASGDDNPIHIDETLARAAGLESCPVQGMLLMTCFVPALEAWRPDLQVQSLSGKFLRPVFASESIEIAGRVVDVRSGQEPSVVLRLLAYNPRREMAIIAEATLISVRASDDPP